MIENAKANKSKNRECSNDSYSPYVQHFFTVISLT